MVRLLRNRSFLPPLRHLPLPVRGFRFGLSLWREGANKTFSLRCGPLVL